MTILPDARRQDLRPVTMVLADARGRELSGAVPAARYRNRVQCTVAAGSPKRPRFSRTATVTYVVRIQGAVTRGKPEGHATTTRHGEKYEVGGSGTRIASRNFSLGERRYRSECTKDKLNKRREGGSQHYGERAQPRGDMSDRRRWASNPAATRAEENLQGTCRPWGRRAHHLAGQRWGLQRRH